MQCTGRLTRALELKTLPSGTSVCEMRLAVDGMGRGREFGYINVAVFSNAAAACAEYLNEGWLVAVDGRLAYGEWTARDQTPRLQRGRGRRVPDRPEAGRGHVPKPGVSRSHDPPRHLDIVLRPDGTDGYEQLVRTATRERLVGTEIVVPVASAEMILQPAECHLLDAGPPKPQVRHRPCGA